MRETWFRSLGQEDVLWEENGYCAEARRPRRTTQKHSWEELSHGWWLRVPGSDGAGVAERVYRTSEVRSGSWEELSLVQGQGQRPRQATPRLRSGAVAERSYPMSKEWRLHWRWRAKRSYSTFKVRRGDLVQGKEQRLHFAGAAMKRYPVSNIRETQVRQQVLQEGIRGQIHWNHYHRKLANLITWTTALSNSMKLSHAVWGHPRQVMVERSDRMLSTGEGNDKPLQYSCLENPMNSMKRQNDRILKEELPRLVGAQYATGDQRRNNSRKNEGMKPKQEQYPVVDVTGDRSKVWCCKEQYCIGTWNVRSMNQGKLEVIKQEMVRVNTDILGISKLKWTGKMDWNGWI